MDVDRWDLFALLGVVMIGAGLALIDPWLGVAAGVLLLAAGLVGGIRAGRADRAADRKGES
ncbi:hypothetical protein [Kitasatospora sp. NPDC002965]|uniref:hypothetical protein n=1 Tax=Kitasatospora sp. NPDC002965 TaxID=3154775 RepID=UPI0033AF36D7